MVVYRLIFLEDSYMKKKHLLRVIFALSTFIHVMTYGAFSGPTSNGTEASNSQSSFSKGQSPFQMKTIKEIKANNTHKMPVTLEGHIINKIGYKKDEYTFKDSTGEIRVDIDHDYFAHHNVEVTPTTKVKIMGRVENEYDKRLRQSHLEVDVKRLDIVK